MELIITEQQHFVPHIWRNKEECDKTDHTELRTARENRENGAPSNHNIDYLYDDDDLVSCARDPLSNIFIYFFSLSTMVKRKCVGRNWRTAVNIRALNIYMGHKIM